MAVDSDKCIACGVCVHLAPEVFAWNEQGRSTAITGQVPEESEQQVVRVMDLCPAKAIYQVEA